MKEKIVIDVGSSSVKVYRIGKKVELLFVRSIFFKDDFDSEKGVSERNKKELFQLMEEVKKSYGANPKVIATAQFRKLSPEARKKFIHEFFTETGLNFEIISQELENLYIEKALVGKAGAKKVLLVNIGGGSTQLVVVHGKRTLERINVDMGVGTLLKEFPEINEEYSENIDNIIGFAKKKLPEIRSKVRYAVYTGGELNYMEIAGYRLEDNDLFRDDNHPKKISTENFSRRNREVFEKIKFKELVGLMPENSKWMQGSRACSTLAQAIFEKYGIKFIVPSDSNIIDGLAREEKKYK